MSLRLNFELPEDVDELYANAAIEWLKLNTTLNFEELTELPDSVKLFIVKFAEVVEGSGGVASESLGGMSQSFVTGSDGLEALLWRYANLFLKPYLKSQVRVIPAESRWRTWE